MGAESVGVVGRSLNAQHGDEAAASKALEASPSQRRQLLSMDDADIPPALIYRLGNIDEIAVDALVRADGTVESVQVLPPAPRQLHRYLVQTVMRWRFEPAAADSTVRLLLDIRP